MSRFYTGIQDYTTFKTLFESFEPAAKSLVYYGSATDSQRLISDEVIKRRLKRSLTLEQEFFLLLVRLWFGLFEEDIAARAGLSQSLESRILITWSDFLHSRLRSYPIWASRVSIDNTAPTSFKEMYPSTRVIIDGTEIFKKTPSSFRSQSITYSNYKHNSTAKGFDGINPLEAVINR